jgi:hypothetical protein
MLTASVVLLALLAPAARAGETLPRWDAVRASGDWLVRPIAPKAAVYRGGSDGELVLANGLVARTFRLAPNAATVGLQQLASGETLLRAVEPEALLEIDGKTRAVGGLVGQRNRAFLRPEWIDQLQADPSAFRFTGFDQGATSERLAWRRVRHAGNTTWPPPGVSLLLHFAGPPGLEQVRVDVNYELYDGLPVFAKWLAVHNDSARSLRLTGFASETLALVEPESIVESSADWLKPNVSVFTDYAFGGMAETNSNRTVHWLADPRYETQVNYEKRTPCLLQVKPPLGPDVEVLPGASFTTFRTFELLHDSWDRERKGLAVRRLFRALAPWSTENPLMLHLTSTDPAVVRRGIDQAAGCGFEMVIISFWSGLDMEDLSPANLAKFRELREHAREKGLELGGYSLLASRTIDAETDVVDPKTGQPGGAIFGHSPCLGSRWGAGYFERIRRFVEETAFDVLEHDGSYPGDVCASTTHPGHRGLADSQWTQYQAIASLYRWARARGTYLNVPDYYFLAGSSKTGMGYRETNWSLPRAEQHVHARQNLFDGTWTKTPSMGWMMVPLVEYQGGGAAATLEPLGEHLADYEQHLANNLGYGAQACYRGPRLYDTEATKAVVVKWVSWFKRHRAILESDVIHVRRADGRDLDAVLHVNPALAERALAVVYNPLEMPLEQEIEMPLHYAGLERTALVSHEDGPPRAMTLDRGSKLKLRVRVPALSRTWYVIRAADATRAAGPRGMP